MVLYDEKMLSDCLKRIKKGTILCVLPLAAAFVFCVGMCFLLSDDKTNATIIHIVNVVVGTLTGWFSLSVLLCYVLPNAKRKRTTEKILSYAEKHVSGKVVSTNGSLTVEGVKVNEIKIDCEGSTVSVYYDIFFGAPKFCVGDKLYLTVSKNFIIAYGVEGHE